MLGADGENDLVLPDQRFLLWWMPNHWSILMSRYLDPKTDIVFKKIFGQHPELLKSFLNAVLPLRRMRLIISLEYLPSEQVPVIPAFKYTVVDVKCTDQQGRVFIVEMQIQWTTSFMQRMLFNASKAYVTPT